MGEINKIKDAKLLAEGERISFKAQVLRGWQSSGKNMYILGDESGLIRIDLADAIFQNGHSYLFSNLLVHQYQGGWTSVSLDQNSEPKLLEEQIPVMAEETYIKRVYKILTATDRKKGGEKWINLRRKVVDIPLFIMCKLIYIEKRI